MISAVRVPTVAACLFAVAGYVACCLGASAAESDSARPAQKQHLTAEQQKHIAELLSSFRRSKEKVAPQERERIVDELVEMGLPAVKQLSDVVNRELLGALKHYGQKVEKRLAQVGRNKSAEVNPAEIQKLRATVLSLRDNADLTHEMIVKKGDPALAQLRQLLLPDRKAVLDDVPELQVEREKLLTVGRLWERCAAELIKDAPPPADGKAAKPPSFKDYLHGVEDQAVDMLLPIPPKDREILAANARLASQIETEETRTILACNLTRALLGLNVASIDPRLCEAARDHSHDMESLKFFAHDSPVEGKKTPWDRAKRQGASASAENIAAGVTDGSAANDMWFHSPGHHKNMLGNHARIGVGRSGALFTEMFGD